MLGEAIYKVITTDAGITALLGTPSTRADKQSGVWPMQAPDQPAVPWIVFAQVSGQPLQESMQGTGRLKTSRWRFTCYGTTYKQATQLAQALTEAMISMDGTQAGAACEVHGAWLRLELDESESLPRGTVFASHRDFEVVYIDTH